MITVLVWFHVAAGIVLAMFSADRPAPSSAVFFAMISCQATLVGIWAGLGTTDRLVRLLVLSLTTAYLALLLGAGIGEIDFWTFLFVSVLSCFSAIFYFVVRLAKADLRRMDEISGTCEEALQFGIRHLMFLTFVVACLVTLGKWAGPAVLERETLVTVSLLGLTYASVAVTSVWAVLGLRRTWLRIVVMFLITVLAGVSAEYTVPGRGDNVFWFAMAQLDTLFLVTSLLIVRRAGYRLIASDSP